jgi:hypothetical protein
MWLLTFRSESTTSIFRVKGRQCNIITRKTTIVKSFIVQSVHTVVNWNRSGKRRKSIYLSVCLWLYSPLLDLGRFSVPESYTQSLGLFRRRISPSKRLCLYTEQYIHRINAHRHPCLEWDSNPRPQSSCLGLRGFWAQHKCIYRPCQIIPVILFRLLSVPLSSLYTRSKIGEYLWANSMMNCAMRVR